MASSEAASISAKSEYPCLASVKLKESSPTVLVSLGFWYLVCYAATLPTLQLHQERIQVVRNNRVARKPWRSSLIFPLVLSNKQHYLSSPEAPGRIQLHSRRSTVCESASPYVQTVCSVNWCTSYDNWLCNISWYCDPCTPYLLTAGLCNTLKCYTHIVCNISVVPLFKRCSF